MNTRTKTHAGAMGRRATGGALVVAAMIVVSGWALCDRVWAANSIYSDDDNVPNIWGSGVGMTDQAAEQAALADCIAKGGVHCTKVFTQSHSPGWGAVAYDADEGVSILVWTYSSKKKAKKAAKRSCKQAGGTNCRIVTKFYDEYGG